MKPTYIEWHAYPTVWSYSYIQ